MSKITTFGNLAEIASPEMTDSKMTVHIGLSVLLNCFSRKAKTTIKKLVSTVGLYSFKNPYPISKIEIANTKKLLCLTPLGMIEKAKANEAISKIHLRILKLNMDCEKIVHQMLPIHSVSDVIGSVAYEPNNDIQ